MNHHRKHLSACLIALAALFSTAPMAWAVTAPPAPPATAPTLGNASTFAILADTTVKNAEMAGQPATKVTGDLGVSSNSSATACTGFTNTLCAYGSGVVTGNVYLGQSSLAGYGLAQGAATDAYYFLTNGQGNAQCYDLTGQDLGGQTLLPGVYCFTSDAGLSGILTLQYTSTPATDVWVFQIGGTLITTPGSSVVFVNNVSQTVSQTCSASNVSNVFWQVGSSATLETGTKFVGNILANTSIDLGTTTSLDGRALAPLGGAVVMLEGSNTVTGCNAPGGQVEHSRSTCNQGVGNGSEGCDPGNSNQGNRYPETANPFIRSNDENGGTPGNPGRKGGNN
jgi:Ice-binding-like